MEERECGGEGVWRWGSVEVGECGDRGVWKWEVEEGSVKMC